MVNAWKRARAKNPAGGAPLEQQSDAMQKADRLIAEGNRHEDAGEFDIALTFYREALLAKPDYPRAHMNVGNALERLGRTEEAVSALREALGSSPEYAPARFNLGRLLALSGNQADAEFELREALRVKPDMVEACVLLAHIFASTGRVAEAQDELRQALEVRPDFALAALNLGRLLMDQARFEEAVSVMEHSVAIAPNALSWMLFAINNRSDLDASQIYKLHSSVGAALARTAGPRYTAWSNRADPSKRLKLGYVSGDLFLHPVGTLLKPILEHHDRTGFEIHCFSNSPNVDPVTAKLRQFASNWHQISDLSDDQFAEFVRTNGIDILVDLSGHTNRDRLRAFARHPAPVQVTWLGYLNTTGLPTMDYRICDRHTDPCDETDDLHTEKLFRMPHSQWCYDPWLAPQELATDDRPSERVVFGSFNKSTKITDPCLDLWCRVLEAVPSASLLILDVSSNDKQALLKRIGQRNIDIARISTLERQTVEAYFRTINSVDIALDTLPYNGATTTLDTLWMGVPIAALRGERGIARGGYSILRSMNATELIAENPDEYVDLNVRLSTDQVWRKTLRATLRDRLRASPLMNAAAFVADLETGYRFMWQTWCSALSSRQ